jgi:two-component system response regulator AlgR
MRVLVVDDEALARLRLKTLLAEAPGGVAVDAVAEAADAEQALAALHDAQVRGEPFDLALLDIRMPGRQTHVGLRLAAALKALPRPPAVVFVTAHAEHALTAFDLDAVDYLTKPVRRERLGDALQRVLQRMGRGEPKPSDVAVLADAPALVVSERGRVLRLPLPEVLYLKADQKYVTLRTTSRSVLLDDSLTDLEQRLAALGGPPFLRVHRNALVARHAIRALERREAREAAGGDDDEGPAGEGWAVRVAPMDEWLAVSRRQLAAVRAALSHGG